VITDFFLNLWAGFQEWLFGMLPDVTEADGVIATASNWVGTLITAGSSLGVWIPWVTIGVCVQVAGVVWVMTFLFKIARSVIAHIPFIGGNG